MKCPSCHTKTRVAETRMLTKWSSIRRRRHCPKCGDKFTTIEIIQTPCHPKKP